MSKVPPGPTYAITGIQAGLGPGRRVPVRMEVDDFFNSQDPVVMIQKNLLYLALAKFQEMDYCDKLSYFQVAGIHGMPHIPWDAPGGYHAQYCEHATILFGSWHRPYVALFEQRLYEIMVNEIIPDYPNAIELKEAADQFRLPYWDWARKRPRKDGEGTTIMTYDLPLIVKSREVQVKTPEGNLVSTKNPFFHFAAKDTFGEYNIVPLQISHGDEPYQALPFDRARATSRSQKNPNGDDHVMRDFVSAEGVDDTRDASSDIEEASWYQRLRLGSGHWSLREVVHRLLSDDYFPTYSEFVTTARSETFKDDGKVYLSLEAIHGNIHRWTGGYFGHMGNVPVASFDPIFYLHHANVDRLLAIWQVLHDDKWWSEYTIRDSQSHEIKRVITPDTPLAPFHADENATFHTANSVRYTETLGYTYPEIRHENGESKEKYLERVRNNVKALYGPDPKTQLTLCHHDVLINVSFERFALNGTPFTVSIILEGEVVGEVHNFSFLSKRGNSTSSCPNCRQQEEANIVVTGQVFATHALVRAVKDPQKALKTLSKDDITAYLQQHLSWEVSTPTKEDVHIPTLRVTPVVGRRNVALISEADSTPSCKLEPLEGGITGVSGLPLRELLMVNARWATDGTLIIHDSQEDSQVQRVKLGNWGNYQPLFEGDSL